METCDIEMSNAGNLALERPSVEFIRAVADLLETDAEDLLAELGYLPTEAVVTEREPVAS